MLYHVETSWTNIEGDGFRASDYVWADNEDEACEYFEARCIQDPPNCLGVFTFAETV